MFVNQQRRFICFNLIGSIWKLQPVSDYFNVWVRDWVENVSSVGLPLWENGSSASLNLKPDVERCWASACVVLQEFAGEDTTDLFLEERETALRQAQEEKHKLQMSVPGILNPHELPEEMCDWSSSGSEQRVQNSSEGGKGSREQGRFLLINCFLFKCVCVRMCVWKENEGPDEGPQHSVVRRPNQCQYVNEIRPPDPRQPWRRLVFFFPTNLFYTIFLCVTCHLLLIFC